MNLPEQLHIVLESYINGHKSIVSNLTDPKKKITIKFVCEQLGISSEKVQLIKNSLLEDGYLKTRDFGDPEPFIVTIKGERFWESGGYLKTLKLNQIDEEIKHNTLSKLKLDKKIIWVSLSTSILALLIAAISLYINFKNNSTQIGLINDKLISAVFKDIDGKKKFFGFYRAIITNNGNKPITILGLKPDKNFGILLTTKEGSNKAENTNVDFKIFRIPDTLLSEHFLKKEENLRKFKDEGLEKLSLLNTVIPPGEIYLLNIGTIFDLYSDTTKHFNSMIFTTQLHFSNGQTLNFGAGGPIRHE